MAFYSIKGDRRGTLREIKGVPNTGVGTRLFLGDLDRQGYFKNSKAPGTITVEVQGRYFTAQIKVNMVPRVQHTFSFVELPAPKMPRPATPKTTKRPR